MQECIRAPAPATRTASGCFRRDVTGSVSSSSLSECLYGVPRPRTHFSAALHSRAGRPRGSVSSTEGLYLLRSFFHSVHGPSTAAFPPSLNAGKFYVLMELQHRDLDFKAFPSVEKVMTTMRGD
ncbi:hypothetical protein EVAR_19388_1 [Eumeta japonica]|uniref:Uncharacterized protein n=1 Tax=Eumeta variegata TaxID=151549 RepID=A0A4C1TRI1_EUMVA|nr:hypothetical protein EVAR_19388_1 [Eumeta japonica]